MSLRSRSATVASVWAPARLKDRRRSIKRSPIASRNPLAPAARVLHLVTLAIEGAWTTRIEWGHRERTLRALCKGGVAGTAKSA